jgi:hypothetical protein
MSAYSGYGQGKRMIVADEAHASILVSQLATLLDDQLVSAENGQFERVESLMVASSALADDIVKTRAFNCHAWQAWQDEISRKYQRLELMLASAKEITKGKLTHTKSTLKMLAVYRSSNR